MSLISVMVAVALSGIVSVAVFRLIANQAKAMKIMELREQRSQLLRHYYTAVSNGLLATILKRCGDGNFCAANGTVLIPSKGLYLADNLYAYGNKNSSGRWWKVSASYAAKSKYGGQTAIELTVEFVPSQHPMIKNKLRPHTEVILLPYIP